MKPVISIIMGSKSDWATMQKAAEVLDNFGVAYEKKVVSAHRTPDLMFKHAEEARSRGIKVIIAGAGGAAHLPGMVAAKTTLPVIGVPVKSRALSGVDSLYSIVQMPGGVPVATMAIGEAGATNAALFALRLLSVEDQAIATALADFAEEDVYKRQVGKQLKCLACMVKMTMIWLVLLSVLQKNLKSLTPYFSVFCSYGKELYFINK